MMSSIVIREILKKAASHKEFFRRTKENPKYTTALGLALMMYDDELTVGEVSNDTQEGGLFSFLNIFKKK